TLAPGVSSVLVSLTPEGIMNWVPSWRVSIFPAGSTLLILPSMLFSIPAGDAGDAGAPGAAGFGVEGAGAWVWALVAPTRDPNTTTAATRARHFFMGQPPVWSFAVRASVDRSRSTLAPAM